MNRDVLVTLLCEYFSSQGGERTKAQKRILALFALEEQQTAFWRKQFEDQGLILHDWLEENVELAEAYRHGLETAARIIEDTVKGANLLKTVMGGQADLVGGLKRLADCIREQKKETV